jgi:hypothetical protein
MTSASQTHLHPENYPSLESLLEYCEHDLERKLSLWQDSARAQGLEWDWEKKHCTSIPAHNLHAAVLKRSHVDGTFCMWREQPVELKQVKVPTARPLTLDPSRMQLGESPFVERLSLYPVLRRSATDSSGKSKLYCSVVKGTHPESQVGWKELYEPYDPTVTCTLQSEIVSEGTEVTLQAENSSTFQVTALNELGIMHSFACHWDDKVMESAEKFSEDLPATVVRQPVGVDTTVVKID